MHNTGYEILGLPTLLDKFETDSAEVVKAKLLDGNNNLGGAAVTIPLKLDIMKYMDELTDAAKVIGAVNTVIPLGNKKFRGDNTDWLGIRNALVSNGVPESVGSTAGLVIGAGGTSRAALYALHNLGCKKIYIINRTTSKLKPLIESLPSEFNITGIESAESIEEIKESVGVAVSCVPADKPLDDELLGKLERFLVKGAHAAFVPTLLEAAYKPSVTPVMKISQDKYQCTLSLVHKC